MTWTARQKTWLIVILIVNLTLWLIPTDVVQQIARDRHTLLGRYSRVQFSWILAVAILSAVSLYVAWPAGEKSKRRQFQVIAVLLFLVPMTAVLDFVLRTSERIHYVRQDTVYHRPPHFKLETVFEDKPQAYRTYPNRSAGFGTVRCTITTDERGFRNQTALNQCDVVVLGDSFAEGSRVSDEEAWPARLAAIGDLTVYNLGMSGYNPQHYLDSLRQYGLPLHPEYVLCMIYEGNDFRSGMKKGTFSKRVKTYFKQSPLIGVVEHLLISTFGPINCDGPVKGVEVLDWLPLQIPEGPVAKYYAFAPKQLRDLFGRRQGFEHNKHWVSARQCLQQMNELCVKEGCRLIVIYAPTKAHVTLPLAATSLPTGKVREFTAIGYKKPLPVGDAFLAQLIDGVDAAQNVVGDWCRAESIPCIEITSALQEAAQDGVQVYYTYDQHWTPDGHNVVANAVQEHFRSLLPSETVGLETP